MKLQLKRGPVPLFHQVAEALRYRIATGRLKVGDPLPPIRRAAQEWGVNLHTVRRGYAELAREGLIETRAPTGSRVVDTGRRLRVSSSVKSFLSRTVQEAERDHGLSIERLTDLLRNWEAEPPGPPTVHFIECSSTQALGHCREVREVWHVEALPWSLKESGEELPDGDLIATYFHYSEIKKRWPQSLDRIRFVPIQPDPGLSERIRDPGQGTFWLRVCEMDEAKTVHIAADLRSMLPEHFRLEPTVVDEAGDLLSSTDPSPILLAPRLWGALTPEQREDPRVLEIRYRIDADSLDALGRHLDWSPRRKGTS